MKKFLSILFATAFIICMAVSVFSAEHSKTAFEAGASLALIGGITGIGESRRKIFEGIKSDYASKGIKGVIAPSFIRAETRLQNGAQDYTFHLRLLGNEAPTERKLNDQDAFSVTDIGLFLMAELEAIAGVGVLQTYPNAAVFPDEAGEGLKTAHLEHIYNGFLTAKVGDTNYMPDLPVIGCRVVNTTATTERGPGDGFISLTPQYDFKGSENNEIRLRVPGNANQRVQTLDATAYNSKLVLVLLGFKITGAGR